MIDETDAAGEPSTPGDPVDPVDPADPVDPVDPADPVDPVDPTDPVDPVDPADDAVKGGPVASVVAFARRHRLAVGITGGVLALALLGTGALAAGAAVNAPAGASPATSANATPTPTADPGRAVPAAAPAPSRIRTCFVNDLAADPRLASMQAQVVNAATGEVLFDRGGTTPARTASVMKVLTAAAALATFAPDHTFATTVVQGAEPGSAVLVGGGDLTLSRTPSGTQTVYPGAAHLDELARQVRAAWAADPANPPLTKLVLDSSLFAGEEWHASWDLEERELGYMSSVTALQVDGDRDDPTANTSPRSSDPIGRAGDAFADELGGIAVVERGTAPAGARELGRVASPTVAQLVDKALVVSDNTAAEMLARHVAIATGSGNTFAAINAGVLQGLAGYGVDTAGITVVDGSGLSPDNAVPPSYLTRLFVKVNAREGNLGVLMDGLPVSGQRGSLSYSDRFAGDNAAAAGAVSAKTGWITDGYTLSGVVRAQDGATLTFAIYALGDVTDAAKQAIDTLTTGFFRCGDNLANG